jgi:hypothetical protein
MGHSEGVDLAKDLLSRYDALELVWLVKEAGDRVEAVVLGKEA